MITQTEQRNQVSNLSTADLQEISCRGYSIVEEVGEGQTRKAFRVKVGKGNVSKTAIMKIPTKEVNENSVCTMINKSKGNLDLREVNIANELVHPNIIRILDSFQLDDGRTVNVEDDIQATDLETLVKTAGAIKDPKVLNRIGTQLLDASAYAHEKGILHRDIKPSNFYMQRDGRGMLGDWQTAAKISTIEDLVMPTRGGTQHTYPGLLNAVLTGRPTRATKRTDIYSAATTLYYALTGEDAFKYKIVQDENGKEITVGNKKIKVKLQSGKQFGEEECITPQMHAANVKSAVGKLPARYRSFFSRALLMNSKNTFYSAEEAMESWQKIHDNPWGKLRENIITGVKYVLPAIAASGITALAIYGIATNDREVKPTLQDIMRRVDYSNFSLDSELNPNSFDWRFNSESIVPLLEQARGKLGSSELAIEKDTGMYMKKLLDFARNSHLMDKRLVSSWARACYLNSDQMNVKEYESGDAKIISKFLVPERFVQVNSVLHNSFISDSTAMAYGIMYLKQNLGQNKTVADVFTDYFCSREEVITAKMRTHSQEYLATSDLQDRTIHVGYSRMLDPRKEKIISTAIGLYSITDEEGNLNWDKVPKRNCPQSSYSLPIPPL